MSSGGRILRRTGQAGTSTSRSEPIRLSKRHKLVIVQGHIKAASRVGVVLKGCGLLSVTIDVPSLKSQYEDHIVRTRSRRRSRLTGLLKSADWTVESTMSTFEMRYSGLHIYESHIRLKLVADRIGPGLWARPATSPASISFDYGKADRDTFRGHKDGRNCLVVRAPCSKNMESGICFDVSETLSYHTTSLVPKIPLLGLSGSKIQEVPRLSPRSGWITRVRKKVKGMLRTGHGQGKDDGDDKGDRDDKDDEDEADELLFYGNDKTATHDADV